MGSKNREINNLPCSNSEFYIKKKSAYKFMLIFCLEMCLTFDKRMVYGFCVSDGIFNHVIRCYLRFLKKKPLYTSKKKQKNNIFVHFQSHSQFS